MPTSARLRIGLGAARVSKVALLIALLLIPASIGPTYGQSQDRKRQMLESWLNKVLESSRVNVKPQKVARIDDQSVQTVFPGSNFYGVSFATWPIAPRLPKELSHDTLVRVRDNDTIEPIRDQ